ncbi:MFS transporter [Beijerinckia sp. L45]|uniref:MFS transporter n=1 Tax=Beijerinckia sp. L45 TaxID=1641855 RepID=UPI00131CC7F7|nr:MFS transporter [Beijerinckia sp. L45]
MSESLVIARSAGNADLETTEDLLRHDALRSPSPWRWVIAFVMLATVVTGFFDRISIAVLFTDPSFNAAIGTGFRPAMLGLLMTAFLLAYAISAIFLSFLGDLLGPRRALGYAAGLWGVMMLLMGSCSSYAAMMFCRVILGLSEGPQFSLIAKTVQRWFPPREQGRANAVWMVGSPIGSAIGFPLTIWLVASYGWRASFYVLGALSLIIVMPLVFSVLRDRSDAPVAAVRTPLRLADVRLVLSDKRVWLLSIYCAGFLTYLWGLNGWLPTYLEKVRHFNLRQMGLYSSLPFVLMFFAEVASGFIADRTGHKALVCVVGLFMAGVLLFVGTLVDDPHVAAIIIALSAGAWGFGAPPQYALAMKVLPASVTSTGVGVINGIGNLVGACAPALIGWLVALTGSFQVGLMIVVAAAVLSSLALIPLIRLR